MLRNKLFQKLKNRTPKNLDKVIHEFHDDAFKKISCLDCANCCKTTGPLWTKRDRERVAKHLRLETSIFENSYLRIDEDRDYVLKELPCPFLENDNQCSIYDVRPKACAEYPHTNRPKQHKILHLTQVNADICPAVENIVERMESIYSKNAKKGPKKELRQ
ncbi:MAG: Uncharacterised protein [Owenweeksia sp. TMED14]|nr:MAG: Uncharacterised protein [Owenweeksia sp. TMED14]